MLRRSLIATSRLLLGSILLVGSAVCAVAAPAPENFQTQCPDLLAQTNQFASQCVTKARTLTRYFSQWPSISRGMPETRSAYFQKSSVRSHFGLGCTLGSTRHIATLGVYYSVDPETFGIANDEPLLSITADGNVDIKTSAGVVHLILIRQFVTDRVKPGRALPGLITNCGPAEGPDGWIHWAWGSFKATETREGKDFTIRGSPLGTYCYPSGTYVKLLGGEAYPIIAPGLGCWWFITGDGSLLVYKDVYQRFCVNHEPDNSIVSETCNAC